MQKAAEESLELGVKQAAEVCGMKYSALDRWISKGLIRMKRGPAGHRIDRYLDEAGLLSILLVRLLRSNGVAIERIAPIAAFLSSRNRLQLEREMDQGRTIVFAAGTRVGFAEPNAAIANDTGEATILIAVDLIPLLGRVSMAIDKYNRRVTAATN